jgi:hypothetical protein
LFLYGTSMSHAQNSVVLSEVLTPKHITILSIACVMGSSERKIWTRFNLTQHVHKIRAKQSGARPKMCFEAKLDLCP